MSENENENNKTKASSHTLSEENDKKHKEKEEKEKSTENLSINNNDVTNQKKKENPNQSNSSNNKLHKCLHCGRSYVHKKHLKRHEITHTGHRPYKCDYCGRSFERSDIKKRHKSSCKAMLSFEQGDLKNKISSTNKFEYKQKKNISSFINKIISKEKKDDSFQKKSDERSESIQIEEIQNDLKNKNSMSSNYKMKSKSSENFLTKKYMEEAVENTSTERPNNKLENKTYNNINKSNNFFQKNQIATLDIDSLNLNTKKTEFIYITNPSKISEKANLYVFTPPPSEGNLKNDNSSYFIPPPWFPFTLDSHDSFVKFHQINKKKQIYNQTLDLNILCKEYDKFSILNDLRKIKALILFKENEIIISEDKAISIYMGIAAQL